MKLSHTMPVLISLFLPWTIYQNSQFSIWLFITDLCFKIVPDLYQLTANQTRKLHPNTCTVTGVNNGPYYNRKSNRKLSSYLTQKIADKTGMP